MGRHRRHAIRNNDTNVISRPERRYHDGNHISTYSLTHIYWCISLASSAFYKINKRIYTNSTGDFR